VRALGCEAALNAFYACVILRCGDPESDIFASCRVETERYDACLASTR
jgi:hypothetical protein